MGILHYDDISSATWWPKSKPMQVASGSYSQLQSNGHLELKMLLTASVLPLAMCQMHQNLLWQLSHCF